MAISLVCLLFTTVIAGSYLAQLPFADIIYMRCWWTGFILSVSEDVDRLGSSALVANHSKRRTAVSINPRVYGVLGNLEI